MYLLISRRFLFSAFLLCNVYTSADGSGAMIRPRHRGMVWTSVNRGPTQYSYLGLNCGGIEELRRNDGRCGLCGDSYSGPRDHENGGKYDTGYFSENYAAGDQHIETKILLNTLSDGYFEFRLCDANGEPETRRCFDRHLLNVVEGRAQGNETRYEPYTAGLLTLNLEIPDGLSCSACILQWKYRTAGHFGFAADGRGCIGCGQQGEFYNCADISINSRTDPLPPAHPVPSRGRHMGSDDRWRNDRVHFDNGNRNDIPRPLEDGNNDGSQESKASSIPKPPTVEQSGKRLRTVGQTVKDHLISDVNVNGKSAKDTLHTHSSKHDGIIPSPPMLERSPDQTWIAGHNHIQRPSSLHEHSAGIIHKHKNVTDTKTTRQHSSGNVISNKQVETTKTVATNNGNSKNIVRKSDRIPAPPTDKAGPDQPWRVGHNHIPRPSQLNKSAGGTLQVHHIESGTLNTNKGSTSSVIDNVQKVLKSGNTRRKSKSDLQTKHTKQVSKTMHNTDSMSTMDQMSKTIPSPPITKPAINRPWRVVHRHIPHPTSISQASRVQNSMSTHKPHSEEPVDKQITLKQKQGSTGSWKYFDVKSPEMSQHNDLRGKQTAAMPSVITHAGLGAPDINTNVHPSRPVSSTRRVRRPIQIKAKLPSLSGGKEVVTLDPSIWSRSGVVTQIKSRLIPMKGGRFAIKSNVPVEKLNVPAVTEKMKQRTNEHTHTTPSGRMAQLKKNTIRARKPVSRLQARNPTVDKALQSSKRKSSVSATLIVFPERILTKSNTLFNEYTGDVYYNVPHRRKVKVAIDTSHRRMYGPVVPTLEPTHLPEPELSPQRQKSNTAGKSVGYSDKLRTTGKLPVIKRITQTPSPSVSRSSSRLKMVKSRQRSPNNHFVRLNARRDKPATNNGEHNGQSIKEVSNTALPKAGITHQESAPYSNMNMALKRIGAVLSKLKNRRIASNKTIRNGVFVEKVKKKNIDPQSYATTPGHVKNSPLPNQNNNSNMKSNHIARSKNRSKKPRVYTLASTKQTTRGHKGKLNSRHVTQPNQMHTSNMKSNHIARSGHRSNKPRVSTLSSSKQTTRGHNGKLDSRHVPQPNQMNTSNMKSNHIARLKNLSKKPLAYTLVSTKQTTRGHKAKLDSRHVRQPNQVNTSNMKSDHIARLKNRSKKPLAYTLVSTKQTTRGHKAKLDSRHVRQPNQVNTNNRKSDHIARSDHRSKKPLVYTLASMKQTTWGHKAKLDSRHVPKPNQVNTSNIKSDHIVRSEHRSNKPHAHTLASMKQTIRGHKGNLDSQPIPETRSTAHRSSGVIRKTHTSTGGWKKEMHPQSVLARMLKHNKPAQNKRQRKLNKISSMPLSTNTSLGSMLQVTTIKGFVDRLLRKLSKNNTKGIADGKSGEIKVVPLTRNSIMDILREIAAGRPAPSSVDTVQNRDRHISLKSRPERAGKEKSLVMKRETIRRGNGEPNNNRDRIQRRTAVGRQKSGPSFGLRRMISRGHAGDVNSPKHPKSRSNGTDKIIYNIKSDHKPVSKILFDRHGHISVSGTNGRGLTTMRINSIHSKIQKRKLLKKPNKVKAESKEIRRMRQALNKLPTVNLQSSIGRGNNRRKFKGMTLKQLAAQRRGNRKNAPDKHTPSVIQKPRPSLPKTVTSLTNLAKHSSSHGFNGHPVSENSGRIIKALTNKKHLNRTRGNILQKATQTGRTILKAIRRLLKQRGRKPRNRGVPPVRKSKKTVNGKEVVVIPLRHSMVKGLLSRLNKSRRGNTKASTALK